MSKISKITLTLIFGQLLAVNSIIAQDQGGNTQAIDNAMSALDEFMEAFNSRDMKAWAATLNYPHVRFASEAVTVWANAEEFERGATFDRLPRIG